MSSCSIFLFYALICETCGMIHLFWPPTNSGTWFRGCLRMRSSCQRTHTDSWTHSHSWSHRPGHSTPSLQHSGVARNCTVRQRETWSWTGGSDIIDLDGHHLSGRHTSWSDLGWAAWGLGESSWEWMAGPAPHKPSLLDKLVPLRSQGQALAGKMFATFAPTPQKEKNVPHDVRDLHRYQRMLPFPHWWTTSLKKAQLMCLFFSWP